jgi:hypothetical protein
VKHRRDKGRTQGRADRLLRAAGFVSLTRHDLYTPIVKAVTATAPDDHQGGHCHLVTAIKHSAKSRPSLAPNPIWCGMLSDFVHHDKASHSFYLGLANVGQHDDILMTEVDVAAATPPARAEFTLRRTLPAVLANAANIESNLRRLVPLVRLWSARTEGKADILDGKTLRFRPGQDDS